MYMTYDTNDSSMHIHKLYVHNYIQASNDTYMYIYILSINETHVHTLMSYIQELHQKSCIQFSKQPNMVTTLVVKRSFRLRGLI